MLLPNILILALPSIAVALISNLLVVILPILYSKTSLEKFICLPEILKLESKAFSDMIFSNLLTLILYVVVLPSSAVTIISKVLRPVSKDNLSGNLTVALVSLGTAWIWIVETLLETSKLYSKVLGTKSIDPELTVRDFNDESLLLTTGAGSGSGSGVGVEVGLSLITDIETLLLLTETVSPESPVKVIPDITKLPVPALLAFKYTVPISKTPGFLSLDDNERLGHSVFTSHILSALNLSIEILPFAEIFAKTIDICPSELPHTLHLICCPGLTDVVLQLIERSPDKANKSTGNNSEKTVTK